MGEFGLGDVELIFGEFGGTAGSFKHFVALISVRSCSECVFLPAHESPHELLFDIKRFVSSKMVLSLGFCSDRARCMLGD